MKLSVIFLFVFFAKIVWGQELIQDLIDPQYQNSALLKLGGKEVKAPYWLENFETGIITLKSGKVINNMQLNIDTNSGNLIAIKDGGEVIINSKIVERVQLYSNKRIDTLIFKQVNIPGERAGFCEVIYDGDKIKLFKQMKATLKPNSQESNSGYHTDQPKDLFAKKTLYFIEEKSILKEIKLNKKALLQHFASIPGINEFVKDNKLNLSDVVDVKFFLQEVENK